MTIGRRLAVGAAAIAHKKDMVFTGPVLKNCSVTATGIEFYFNDTLLKDDAVTVFPAVDGVDLAGMPLGGKGGLSTALCAAFPNGSENPYCSSFGALSPLEVEYTFETSNGTVSAWLPVRGGVRLQLMPARMRGI